MDEELIKSHLYEIHKLKKNIWIVILVTVLLYFWVWITAFNGSFKNLSLIQTLTVGFLCGMSSSYIIEIGYYLFQAFWNNRTGHYL